MILTNMRHLPIIVIIMPKDINSEEYDAGTKLKLDILSKYLVEWFHVMINLDFLRTIYLYDFFQVQVQILQGILEARLFY